MSTHIFLFSTALLSLLNVFLTPIRAEAAYHFAEYVAHSPLRVYATTGSTPRGFTPKQIKKIYGLPADGGSGTIVIIGAYDAVSIEKDLHDFNSAFALPACTRANGCLTVHKVGTSVRTANNGWALETALDVEWAHAIAPHAKLVLVEAATPSGANLLKAVDYAASLHAATAISMSWGGAEFPEETSLDSHFKSVSGAPFFAASGDQGAGASWPASSPEVISVGGTTLRTSKTGSLTSETTWSGSGGGVSAYEKAPSYQTAYRITQSNGMRAIPDVAYDANPATGFPIVHDGVWRTVGGTSAGAPQWAAIASLGTVSISRLYIDAKNADREKFLYDISVGENGTCGYRCTAHTGYDFVTGLGTPRTSSF